MPSTDSTTSSLPTSEPNTSSSSTNSTKYQWDTEELPQHERLELAYKTWKKEEGKLSQRKAAFEFGVPHTSLWGRIHGAKPLPTENEERQRLCPEEETILVKWITHLQVWGWPARVEQTRFMAEDLLRAKGDTKELGKNWIQKFQRRHPELKSKYIPPLDKERALAQDPETLWEWFQLYTRIKDEYNIKPEDTYNMDEKGFMQGVIAKLKVIISKHKAQKHITQPGNREWSTIIECISLDGRALRPWVIFKAKANQLAWYDAYPEAHITWSENGWTDNEIGLWYFEKCFHPETAATQQGEYRLLLLDGHASHISTRTIQFCIDHKIILLCLPPHTTHILQPLDVGIFAPLSTFYKNRIHEITRFGAGYGINKVDFLEALKYARNRALTQSNIQQAWKTAAILPYNPYLILQKFLSEGQTIEEYIAKKHATAGGKDSSGVQWAPADGEQDTPGGIEQNTAVEQGTAVEQDQNPRNIQAVQDSIGTPAENSQTEHYSVTFPTTTTSEGHPYTPNAATIRYDGPAGSYQKIMTPANTLQVRILLKQALQDSVDEEIKEEIIKKVGKSAMLAIADCTLQDRTNKDLLALAARSDAKKKRKKGQCNGARVMNQEVLTERQEIWNWHTQWERFRAIKSTFFIDRHVKIPTEKRYARWKAKQDAEAKKQAAAQKRAQDQAEKEAQKNALKETRKQATPRKRATPRKQVIFRKRAHKPLIASLQIRAMEGVDGQWVMEKEPEVRELGRGHRKRRIRRLS